MLRTRLFPLLRCCVLVIIMMAMVMLPLKRSVAASYPLLSLRDAILLSVRYNPDIQNAEVQRVVDKYNLRVSQFAFELQYALNGQATYNTTVANGVKSGSDSQNLIPTASLTGPYGTTIQTTILNPVTHSVGFARFYNPAATVSITQPLLRGFGPDITLAPLYNAEDIELVNRLILKNTLISTITSVVVQYIATFQAQNNIKAQEASLKQVQAAYEQAKLLVKAGRRGPADLLQFEANAASQKLTLQQNQVALLQAKETLLNLIGLEPQSTISLPESIQEIIKKIPSLKESIAITLANNPTYQQAIIGIRVLKRQLAVSKDNIRPQLDLSLTQTQGGGSGGLPNAGPESLVNGSNHSTTVMLTLSVPISTLPQEQAIASSQVALQQAITNLAALKRSIELNVMTTYNTLLSQKEQVKQANQAVMFAKKTYDIANIKLKYGKISSFEVNTLQVNLITAVTNYISTFATYITTQANFDSILGITTDRWELRVRY